MTQGGSLCRTRHTRKRENYPPLSQDTKIQGRRERVRACPRVGRGAGECPFSSYHPHPNLLPSREKGLLQFLLAAFLPTSQSSCLLTSDGFANRTYVLSCSYDCPAGRRLAGGNETIMSDSRPGQDPKIPCPYRHTGQARLLYCAKWDCSGVLQLGRTTCHARPAAIPVNARFCPEWSRATGQEKGVEQFTEKENLSSNSTVWRGGEVGRIDRHCRVYYRVRTAGLQGLGALAAPVTGVTSPRGPATGRNRSTYLQCVNTWGASRNTADFPPPTSRRYTVAAGIGTATSGRNGG